MSYSIKTIPRFDKQLKKIAKKYPSFKNDFLKFIAQIIENPIQGNPLGNNCYKVRLAISDKQKGKSGGARVITNIMITEQTVYLIAIYDKSEQDSLTNKELAELLQDIP